MSLAERAVLPPNSRIVVWRRYNSMVGREIFCLSEDIVKTTIEYLSNFWGRESVKIEFRYYDKIDDLAEITHASRSYEKSILVLASKYQFSDLMSRMAEIDCYGRIPNMETLREMLRFYIANFSSIASESRVIQNMKSFQKSYLTICSAISRLEIITPVHYDRLYNLQSSALGVHELGRALARGGNYMGLILNLINEVDTTNYILFQTLKCDPRCIISPCEHDRMRVRYALNKLLSEYGISNLFVDSLDYIGPHNNLGFVPPETIKVGGKCIEWFLPTKELVMLVDKATCWGNQFGERIFKIRGSSDCDVVESTLLILRHIIYGINQPLTVSHYWDEHDVFCTSSGVVAFDVGFTRTMCEWSDSSMQRLREAIYYQKTINRSIIDSIFLN